MAAYSVGKAAEETLLRTLAREVAGDGITVNVVSVRKIDTEHERETVAVTEERVVDDARGDRSDDALPLLGRRGRDHRRTHRARRPRLATGPSPRQIVSSSTRYAVVIPPGPRVSVRSRACSAARISHRPIRGGNRLRGDFKGSSLAARGQCRITAWSRESRMTTSGDAGIEHEIRTQPAPTGGTDVRIRSHRPGKPWAPVRLVPRSSR